MHSFEVHSNESTCRKKVRLGLEQVICAVNWVTIPGILRYFRIMEKDVMRASVLTNYCLHFFEKEVIFFNARALMIPTCKRPIYHSQGCVHIFEDTLEPAVGVNGKNRSHVKRENEILHEKFRKMFRMCLCSNSKYKKLR